MNCNTIPIILNSTGITAHATANNKIIPKNPKRNAIIIFMCLIVNTLLFLQYKDTLYFINKKIKY